MDFFGTHPQAGDLAKIYFAVQLVIFIGMAIHILLRKQDPVACLGWLLAAALFPVAALFLYMIGGTNPFLSYARRKQKAKKAVGNEAVGHLSDDLRAITREQLTTLDLPGFPNTTHWVSQSTGRALTLGDSINLLATAADAYSEHDAAIKRASDYILIEFYQIQHDDVGMRFLDLLAEKAHMGVRVYVLFDALGSFGLTEERIASYRKSGMKIFRYLEINFFKRRFQVNWRNHRKLIICDGKVAYIGGINVGSMYLGTKGAARWIDVNYKIQGSSIEALQQAFIEDWHFTTGETLKYLEPKSQNDAKESLINSDSLIGVIPSGPAGESPLFHSTLLSTLFEAKKRVWLTTPYFIPDRALLQAFYCATRRGVDVRVFIPKKSNHPSTDFCSQAFFPDVLQTGLRLFRFNKGVTHGKVVIADDDLVLTGSSNLDPRSFYLNFELDLFIRSKTLCKELEKYFRILEEGSTILTRRQARTWNPLTLIGLRIARLAAPVM